MPANQLLKTYHRITKHDLLLLLDKNDFEILKNLVRSEFGFFVFLEKRAYSVSEEPQLLELVVKILNQACSLRIQKFAASRAKLFRLLKDCQEFLFEDIPKVINSCFKKSARIDLVSFIAHYMNILASVLENDFFPCQKIIEEIFPSLENYMNRLREKKILNLGIAEESFNNLVKKVELYENPNESDAEDEGVTNFRSLSVVPRSFDILNCEIHSIPKNIIDDSYKSVDHFLSVHYRLMREDMLRSFRECVKSCLTSREKGYFSMNKSCIYEKVTLVSPPEYGNDGICYNIKVHSSIEIDWAEKGVLRPGSLVFLTPNSFNSVIFATVVSNPKVSYNKNKECKLKIKLEDDLFLDSLMIDSVYQMIEPAAYFECYKHVLSAIKGFRENNFPLSDIIVYLDYADPEPDYLEGIKYCLHEKCGNPSKHNSTFACKDFNPMKDDEWPTAEDLELDGQQFIAFKTALTKKVAVIQGPPGTGKTHVGVKIVKALLENTPRKPIVISCLTNHALDQFLELILKFTNKIVRLGSQSKSKILEPHQMQNLIYAIRQYEAGNTLDKSQQKSLDLVKQFASIVLNGRISSDRDPEYYEIRNLSQEINSNIHSIFLCEDKYLDDSALNDIIDSEYKEQLRNTPGSIKKSLSSSVLEWLVCSHSSDLYEKCFKKFLKFKNETTIKPEFNNVWHLCETKRFQLFYCWRKNCLEIRKKNLESDIEIYRKLMTKLQTKSVDAERLEILKGAFIIGVTTTGACKYKDLIQFSEPCILVIEEAAQVLESHVIASLVPSIQHLILIGDHQQLRPLPANHELSEKYNLKVSMFERLFLNRAPSATLVTQHRMKPCIAELLVPVPYTDYLSNKNVYEYEEIKGVQSSVFFFDHQMHEDSNSSGTSSSNDFEARMIVSLAKYFFLQSYSLSQMTILATYCAQVVLIHEYLQKENLCEIHVTTVDNFQGEENDIILLSFVRSNPTASIGFLKESNRVCVALSRAKMGMFCFGNFQLFSRKNDLWRNIVEKVTIKNMIGDSISLKCDRHQTIQSVKCENDILKFISSGCSEICNFMLSCKHRCSRTCHFNDSDHILYRCQQPCERMIDESRVCPRLCYEKCKRIKKKQIELPCGHLGPGTDLMCLKEIQRLLPCYHVVTLPCHLDIENYKCKATVTISLDCGHTKPILCHEHQKGINIICTDFKQEIGVCGHYINVPCSLNLDKNELLPFCNKACGILLDCGHPCVMLCRYCFDTGIHGFCMEKCDLRLSCGHTCDGCCNSPCPPCKNKCFLSCSHRTQCINECLRSCIKCERPCGRICAHNCCSKKCYQKCDVKPCMLPCTKKLSCGHQCIGFCGDPCPHLCRTCHTDDLTTGTAENSLYVELKCEHVIDANELTEHINNCLISYEWPCCPQCHEVITVSARYKEALMEAKEISMQSCDTSEDVSEILYFVESMYGINYIPPAEFLPIHKKIMHILKKTVPHSDSLIVLKNCIIFLKRLAIIKSKLVNLTDNGIQNRFDTLLLWISYHLTNASFQQLKELESSIKQLEKDILQCCA